MKTFQKLSLWLWAVLKPLGAWGVFAIAGMDGAGVPLPGAVDAVLATYVYNNPLHAWLYVAMATLGSAAGCCVVYAIGYWGGEAVLQKRMPPWKFKRIQGQFEEHKFLALALPAMLPPPFPFKIFVLAAAVFEMRLPNFLLAIVSGRIVRYGVLAALTVKFGPQVVPVIGLMVRRHLGLTLLLVTAIVSLALLVRRLRRNAVTQVME